MIDLFERKLTYRWFLPGRGLALAGPNIVFFDNVPTRMALRIPFIIVGIHECG